MAAAEHAAVEPGWPHLRPLLPQAREASVILPYELALVAQSLPSMLQLSSTRSMPRALVHRRLLERQLLPGACFPLRAGSLRQEALALDLQPRQRST